MSDRHRHIIDLAVGDPAGSPPAMLQAALHDAFKHPDANHYPNPNGLNVTREAIVGYYARRHGVVIDPGKVAITHGARPAIYFGLRAIERPRQAVGFFTPAYTAFPPQILNADMQPTPIALPDAQLTRANLLPLLRYVKGGAFIFNNPHNPTGRVFGPDEITAFCNVARIFDIRVISDFVYADLYETATPISTLMIDPTVIEVNSLSKPYRACGWRVGAVVGDPIWIAKIVDRYATLNGVPVAIQRTAALAWTTMPEVEEFRHELARRRNVLVDGLRNIGFTVDTEMQNKSGMFVWAKIPDRCMSGADVKRQLDAFGVLVTGGGDFGGNNDRNLRFALNEPAEVIGEAVTRISNALEAYYDRQDAAVPARRADGRAA